MSFKAIDFLTAWKEILQPILDRNLIIQSGKITMDVELGKIQPLIEVMESSEDTNQQETKENWFRNNSGIG